MTLELGSTYKDGSYDIIDIHELSSAIPNYPEIELVGGSTLEVYSHFVTVVRANPECEAPEVEYSWEQVSGPTTLDFDDLNYPGVDTWLLI